MPLIEGDGAAADDENATENHINHQYMKNCQTQAEMATELPSTQWCRSRSSRQVAAKYNKKPRITGACR